MSLTQELQRIQMQIQQISMGGYGAGVVAPGIGVGVGVGIGVTTPYATPYTGVPLNRNRFRAQGRREDNFSEQTRFTGRSKTDLVSCAPSRSGGAFCLQEH